MKPIFHPMALAKISSFSSAVARAFQANFCHAYKISRTCPFYLQAGA
jgi:hypothetical protein